MSVEYRLDDAHDAAESVVDSLGILHGTDKSSLQWDYLRHYEREFAPFRDLRMTVLEIGVAGGRSLQVWRDYFSFATIVGLDINPACSRFAEGRVAVETGSQADAAFLTGVCERHGAPTIVIDDGSHRADHIRFSFEHLFPRLAAGGCYVVEDIHFHYRPGDAEALRGTATETPQVYLSALANQVLAAQFSDNLPVLVPPAICAAVDRVLFLPRAVMIWKRADTTPDARMTRWERLAEQSGRDYNWEWMARQIMRNGWPIARAEQAARKAIALNPRHWKNHQILSDVLERAGDFAASCQAAEEAISRLPPKADVGAALAKRLERLRRHLPAAGH